VRAAQRDNSTAHRGKPGRRAAVTFRARSPMIELLLQTSRLAGQSYEQLFTDERALTRFHQRETVWLLGFVAVCVALFATGAAGLAAQDLARRLQSNGQGVFHAERALQAERPLATGPEGAFRDVPLLAGETVDFGLAAFAGWSVAALLAACAFAVRDRTPAVLRILRDRPEDVSWAYVVVLVGHPARGVFVGTRRGEREAITLAGMPELFLERVAALCPHAVLGHSLAREEQFDRDPTMGRFPSTAVTRERQA
jgi:hypothetical protein